MSTTQLESERTRLRDELLKQLAALGEWRAGNRKAWLVDDVVRVVSVVFGVRP